MPLLTLTASGTPQPFVDGTTIAATNPTARFCSRVQIKNEGAGIAYIGVQKPLGVSNGVSATATPKVYDISLQPGDAQMIGWGDDVYVDLGAMYWDSDTSGNQITFLPETY